MSLVDYDLSSSDEEIQAFETSVNSYLRAEENIEEIVAKIIDELVLKASENFGEEIIEDRRGNLDLLYENKKTDGKICDYSSNLRKRHFLGRRSKTNGSDWSADDSDIDSSSSDSSSESEDLHGKSRGKKSDAHVSEDSDYIYTNIVLECQKRQIRAQKFTKQLHVPVTRGELSLEDLPKIENLHISVPPGARLVRVGTVSSIIDKLAVIQSDYNVPALDEETWILDGQRQPVGQIFEIFGPVIRPLYSIRFNTVSDVNDRLSIGDVVFFVADSNDLTKTVFTDALRKMKGTDASWEDNNEPPADVREFSDDEEERQWKAQRKASKNSSGPLEEDLQTGQRPKAKAVRKRQGGNRGNFTATVQSPTFPSFRNPWHCGQGRQQGFPLPPPLPPPPMLHQRPIFPAPRLRPPQFTPTNFRLPFPPRGAPNDFPRFPRPFFQPQHFMMMDQRYVNNGDKCGEKWKFAMVAVGQVATACAVAFTFGYGACYMMYKHAQRKVVASPHSQTALKILMEHPRAMSALGPPVGVDTNFHFVSPRVYKVDEKAKTFWMKIPVRGQIDHGFLFVDGILHGDKKEDYSVTKMDLLLKRLEKRFTIFAHPEFGPKSSSSDDEDELIEWDTSKKPTSFFNLRWLSEPLAAFAIFETDLLSYMNFTKMVHFSSWELNDKLDYIWTTIRSNLDLDYLSWLLWLFTPILISFLLPAVLLILVYGNALFLHVYKLRHRLRAAYARDFWDGARSTLASFWDAHGTVWHGYELIGLDNIPDKGPALIVYYHGTLPLDVYYLLAKCILYKQRLVHCVGDKFLFKVPGWKTILEVFCISPGTVESCVELLNRGEVLCISPGGVREALFSDPRMYNLLWRQRFGFVKIALETKVPIIPMFTENCREAFRTPRWGRRFLRKFYETTRLPLVPIYGGFPVKLRTHIGVPVEYDPDNITQEELREKVKEGIEFLINKHQHLPGSIIRALLQRFSGFWNKKTSAN